MFNCLNFCLRINTESDCDEEWGKRICVYLSATPIAGAFGGWIAYGVAHISNPNIENWQVLCEYILT